MLDPCERLLKTLLTLADLDRVPLDVKASIVYPAYTFKGLEKSRKSFLAGGLPPNPTPSKKVLAPVMLNLKVLEIGFRVERCVSLQLRLWGSRINKASNCQTPQSHKAWWQNTGEFTILNLFFNLIPVLGPDVKAAWTLQTLNLQFETLLEHTSGPLERTSLQKTAWNPLNGTLIELFENLPVFQRESARPCIWRALGRVSAFQLLPKSRNSWPSARSPAPRV